MTNHKLRILLLLCLIHPVPLYPEFNQPGNGTSGSDSGTMTNYPTGGPATEVGPGAPSIDSQMTTGIFDPTNNIGTSYPDQTNQILQQNLIEPSPPEILDPPADQQQYDPTIEDTQLYPLGPPLPGPPDESRDPGLGPPRDDSPPLENDYYQPKLSENKMLFNPDALLDELLNADGKAIPVFSDKSGLQLDPFLKPYQDSLTEVMVLEGKVAKFDKITHEEILITPSGISASYGLAVSVNPLDQAFDFVNQVLNPKDSQSAAERKAVIADFSGDVFVSQNGSLPIPAASGMVLNEMDEIRTRENSHAKLLLDEGGRVGTLELREKSLLRIHTMDVISETGEKKTLLDLAIGNVLIEVGKLRGNSSFEVDTPTATTGVRGTVFEVAVTPLKKETHS